MEMGRTSAMVSVHVMIEHLCIGVHGVFSEESRRIAACSVFFYLALDVDLYVSRESPR
jgi:hypothetical protein